MKIITKQTNFHEKYSILFYFMFVVDKMVFEVYF